MDEEEEEGTWTKLKEEEKMEEEEMKEKEMEEEKMEEEEVWGVGGDGAQD